MYQADQITPPRRVGRCQNAVSPRRNAFIATASQVFRGLVQGAGNPRFLRKPGRRETGGSLRPIFPKGIIISDFLRATRMSEGGGPDGRTGFGPLITSPLRSDSGELWRVRIPSAAVSGGRRVRPPRESSNRAAKLAQTGAGQPVKVFRLRPRKFARVSQDLLIFLDGVILIAPLLIGFSQIEPVQGIIGSQAG